MKAMYESHVSGNDYHELMEEAWKDATEAFAMPIEVVKKLAIPGELHMRKTLDGSEKKYGGSVFFVLIPEDQKD
jgi:hypothetical protein